ncbi:MAG TPA: CoA-transferase, partial [Actinomycetes bacterium]|nr:CoA-transferase [Actinomycetes bacterium]
RQNLRHLTLVRMTPDVLYDQMIGVGAADRLVFSWGGNPGVGSLHRFREAVEDGWPHPIELEEHSHAGMAARYVAAASGLPFGTLRGYVGSDLLERTANVATVTCPFTGEELTAVRALDLDVAVIHAQQVDRHGNVGLWGLTGVQKEAVLAADRSIVTVEERVTAFDSRVTTVLPAWVLAAVAVAPHGSHPSYTQGYSNRDNAFYAAWDSISRDRDRFAAWMRRHVLDVDDFGDHLRLVDAESALAG